MLAIYSGARDASTSAVEEIVMEIDLDQARRRAKESNGCWRTIRHWRARDSTSRWRAAGAGILRVTELSYLPGRPVRVSVRRRGHRYDIDDMGTAVAIAGRPRGWREAAGRAVRGFDWNINREGVVFMTAVDGHDIDKLVRRTAEASVAVLEALLEIEELP